MPTPADGRSKALDSALASITKRFGDGAVMRLGEASHLKVDVIPTGSLALDVALGVGGIPRGRVTEIYGPESAGKTTLCQHIVAEAQRRGGLAAYIDMEHALDPVYAVHCGVDMNNLYVAQPDTGEQALEIAEALIRSGALDIDVGGGAAHLLGLGHDVLGEGALPGRLGAVDLGHAAAGNAAHTQRNVQRQGTRGDDLDLEMRRLAQAHHCSIAKTLGDGG